MPIETLVDHVRRLVVGRAHGMLRIDEIFEYQRSAWSRSDVEGYDEIVDLTEVTEIESAPSTRARELASVAASMDAQARSPRLAIVATADFAFGLARMYATYRGLQEGGTKSVEVFRTLAAAREWLGRDEG